ncbi:hypothetical protein FD755_024856 [Muntiacus reevesi]|uniref:Ig-like domain-containing protein n=1 Tax=Muntiacus reevesi TaxID=9886 RepID=A0A5N3USQ6_MUNRE|nr:hypothetical protein FD755_024856 [Muntiacus reevesi]
MAEVLSLQLLTLWLVCPADITPAGAVILKEPLLLLQLRARSPASSPRPWLGAQPAAVVTPGVNVTLRCQAPQPAWRFALFRSAELTAVIHRDVPAELAEFFLEEVTPAQGGSYQCCYWRRGWGPDVWSHPSDALELLVTGEEGPAYIWRGACTMRHTKRATWRQREFSIRGDYAPPPAPLHAHFPPSPPPGLAIFGDISAFPDRGRVCYWRYMGLSKKVTNGNLPWSSG